MCCCAFHMLLYALFVVIQEMWGDVHWKRGWKGVLGGVNFDFPYLVSLYIKNGSYLIVAIDKMTASL